MHLHLDGDDDDDFILAPASPEASLCSACRSVLCERYHELTVVLAGVSYRHKQCNRPLNYDRPFWQFRRAEVVDSTWT